MDFLTWRKKSFGYYGRYYGTVYTVPCQGNHLLLDFVNFLFYFLMVVINLSHFSGFF